MKGDGGFLEHGSDRILDLFPESMCLSQWDVLIPEDDMRFDKGIISRDTSLEKMKTFDRRIFEKDFLDFFDIRLIERAVEEHRDTTTDDRKRIPYDPRTDGSCEDGITPPESQIPRGE